MTAVEQYRPQAAEVATIDPTGGRLIAWAQAASAANQLATSLSRTSFVPKAFQGNPADATAAIMLGDELGLSPISALRSIYIISGTPAMYARTMVALVMSHGHEVWTESSTDREVIVCGRRRGSDHDERAVWTYDRAKKAGYTSNRKYDTDPQGMLYSKAAAEIARKVAPDVLSGIPYSVEDLELEQPEPTTTTRRTTRRQTAPPVVAEPDFDESSVSTGHVDAGPVKVDAAIRPVDPPDGGITPAQLTAINAALTTDFELKDRGEKLEFLSAQLGREIGSSKDLTKAEASKLLDLWKDDGEPAEPTLDGME